MVYEIQLLSDDTILHSLLKAESELEINVLSEYIVILVVGMEVLEILQF